MARPEINLLWNSFIIQFKLQWILYKTLPHPSASLFDMAYAFWVTWFELFWLFLGKRVTCLPELCWVSHIFIHFLKPLTPEPPTSLLLLVTYEFLWSRTTLSATLCRVKRSFKSYQNEHNLVKDTEENGKKACNIDQKNFMQILFHFPPTLPFINSKILKAFLKTFHTKIKPTKCPVLKRKKMRQEKWKKRGGEKVKSKSQDCCLTFKPSKFCFQCMPELRKLIFCIWIKRLRTTRKWPYGKSLSSLYSTTVTRISLD